MNNLLKIALDMTTQDIKANWTAFGKTPTAAEAYEIFCMCWNVAVKVEVWGRECDSMNREFHAGDKCPFCSGELYQDGDELKCSEHCYFDGVA